MKNEYEKLPWSIEDTIEHMKATKEILKVKVKRTNLHGKGAEDAKGIDFDFDRAIVALEKQIPKKPIIKPDKSEYITHRLGRLLSFHCPSCGKLIVAIYETDPERGGGIHRQLKGCSTCLQAINFSGYYQKIQADEEIDWSE